MFSAFAAARLRRGLCLRLCDGGLLRFSAAVTGALETETLRSSSEPLHFLAEYLVKSWGLSPAEAHRVSASKRVAGLKSTEKPEAVLAFLSRCGLDGGDLRKVVYCSPNCLSLDVDKSLAPKIRAMEDLGFSPPELAQMLLSASHIFGLRFHRTFLPKMEFWLGFLGSPGHFTAVLKRSNWFLNASIEKTVVPNLALLRGCGISDQKVAVLVRNDPRLIVISHDKLRELINRASSLGVSRSSPSFAVALCVLLRQLESVINAKWEVMRSFGWSELQFRAAFCKCPWFLAFSGETLRKKMDFFVKEVRCEPSFLACHPFLLTFSVERRIAPRYHLMQVLKSNGCLKKDYSLYPLMCKSHKEFMKMYVIRYKEKVPGLEEMFITWRGSGTV